MSLRVMQNNTCPFFELQITRRQLNSEVDKWTVLLEIETSIRGWIKLSGFSIGNSVVLLETGPEWEGVKEFIHNKVEILWDAIWWHTKYCRKCPLVKEEEPAYSDSDFSEEEGETRERRRENSGSDSGGSDYLSDSPYPWLPWWHPKQTE